MKVEQVLGRFFVRDAGTWSEVHTVPMRHNWPARTLKPDGTGTLRRVGVEGELLSDGISERNIIPQIKE